MYAPLYRWSHELFGYDFIIVHRPDKLMKDIDTYSCRTNPFVLQYLVTTSSIHCHDLSSCSFTYNYDVFRYSSDPRHVQAPSIKLVSTSSFVPVPPTPH